MFGVRSHTYRSVTKINDEDEEEGRKKETMAQFRWEFEDSRFYLYISCLSARNDDEN